MAMEASNLDVDHLPPESTATEKMLAAAKIEHLIQPLQSLPPVDFACAYGSGVFSQTGVASPDVPMVDYILGVSSPKEWHAQNLEQNPNHYSSLLCRGGAERVCWLAENVGVGVHFNPYVKWRSQMIKYGVVSTDNLVKDMLSWDRLYVSGRLHKPVCVIIDDLDLASVNNVNLQAALFVALLLLPTEFSEEDLLTTICNISYMGDVRMLFAEDKHKVRNIVRGSAERLHDLYKKPIFSSAASGHISLPSSFGMDFQCKLHQDDHKASRCSLLSSLPSSLLKNLGHIIGVHYKDEDSGLAIAEALVQRGAHDLLLRRSIGMSVRSSSLRQMVSGLFAAGGSNAVRYVARKASKAWHSRS